MQGIPIIYSSQTFQIPCYASLSVNRMDHTWPNTGFLSMNPLAVTRLNHALNSNLSFNMHVKGRIHDYEDPNQSERCLFFNGRDWSTIMPAPEAWLFKADCHYEAAASRGHDTHTPHHTHTPFRGSLLYDTHTPPITLTLPLESASILNSEHGCTPMTYDGSSLHL